MTIIIKVLPVDMYSKAAYWINKPDINKWLYSEWRSKQVDETLIRIVTLNKKNLLFLVCMDDQPVGIVAISQINNIDQHCSIWYLLGEKGHSGKGIITKAVKLLSEHAFNVLKIHSIEASVVGSNFASRKVLEKNGFSYVGCLKESFYIDNAFVDRLIFEIVKANDT